MDIMIPSYLFSAISMLLMGYNNRYLAIARIIRDFFKDKKVNLGKEDFENIELFRKRLGYIKKLQMFSLYSLLSATISIFLILIEYRLQRESFALALIFFMISLYYSLREILISTKQF
ncbi:MAG: DUF2721 domain-containing protein [Fusobacteriaceae bacterium]|jgi:hypothetical protein|nr:DUF2721 domain-containing protein [Fusobacteriaceae bacterium]